MSSSDRSNRISTTSLGQQSAAAVRRGEVRISDPVPLPEKLTHSSLRIYQEMNCHQPSIVQTSDATWPRQTTTAEQPRSDSGGDQREPSNIAFNRGSTAPLATLSTMSSKNSLKQRKSGGFRATVRSLFGSKRHRASVSIDRSYHISDPGNLVSIREKPIDQHVTRVASQTIPSVAQPSPLGSHSPFTPLPIKRTRSAERVASLLGHRRRNTLPSIVFSEQDAQQIQHFLHGTDAEQTPPPASGVDKSATMPNTLRRRSRSADALTELVSSQLQSPEIWRQSVIDQPLPTYETKGGLGGGKPAVGLLAPGSSRLVSTGSSNSLKPVQNFDFGLLGDFSLEDRVQTLELKCVNFEYAIAGLQGYDVTPVPTARPPKRRSIHDLFSETNAPPSSRATSGQGVTFLRSPADNSSLSDEDRGHVQRSSAATIRPAKGHANSPHRSAAPSPSTIQLRSDQYGELLMMIKEERAARKKLEAQVSELQRQLNAYAALQPAHYATPSPESFHNEPVENRVRPLHRTPAFPRRSRNDLTETSRFSISDTEESDTDAGFHDVYETPQRKSLFNSAEMSPRPTVELF